MVAFSFVNVIRFVLFLIIHASILSNVDKPSMLVDYYLQYQQRRLLERFRYSRKDDNITNGTIDSSSRNTTECISANTTEWISTQWWWWWAIVSGGGIFVWVGSILIIGCCGCCCCCCCCWCFGRRGRGRDNDDDHQHHSQQQRRRRLPYRKTTKKTTEKTTTTTTTTTAAAAVAAPSMVPTGPPTKTILGASILALIMLAGRSDAQMVRRKPPCECVSRSTIRCDGNPDGSMDLECARSAKFLLVGSSTMILDCASLNFPNLKSILLDDESQCDDIIGRCERSYDIRCRGRQSNGDDGSDCCTRRRQSIKVFGGAASENDDDDDMADSSYGLKLAFGLTVSLGGGSILSIGLGVWLFRRRRRRNQQQQQWRQHIPRRYAYPSGPPASVELASVRCHRLPNRLPPPFLDVQLNSPGRDSPFANRNLIEVGGAAVGSDARSTNANAGESSSSSNVEQLGGESTSPKPSASVPVSTTTTTTSTEVSTEEKIYEEVSPMKQ